MNNSSASNFPDNLTSLTMVVAPASDHAEGIDLKSLVRFLSERTGLEINLVYCKDYNETIAALQDGRAQLGWMGAYAYMEATREGKIESFAVGVPKGKNSPNYQSVFIANGNSEIQSLQDVKNKRIAISDRHSTSGFVVPKRELAEIGINLENEGEFKEIIYVHDHDEAIRCVAKGRADVAAVSSVNLGENVSNGVIKEGDFRIIHRSGDIPGGPLVYLKSLPSHTKDSLQRLVLEAHKFIDVGGYGGAMERYLDPLESRLKFL